MTSSLTLRNAGLVLFSSLAWCGLWGSISLANIAVGAALGLGIAATGGSPPVRWGVRPIALTKLIMLVTVDLVRSTANVAYEILTPADQTEESIIAVDLPGSGPNHLLILIIAVTLTPGTAVVDVDPQGATLYLHMLHHSRRDETVAHVQELARLANQAFPVDAPAASGASV